ncbi:glycosyltransferase family 4 protein [Glutamicibacter arilaitensis]|uniref:glycosyltransferase family 4 protein n=1 Tax=Glutamicibacter arilaitensis TaxID=256701 RepID=UPI003FD5B78D
MMSEKSKRTLALFRIIRSSYVISMFLLSFIILCLLVTIWILVGNPSTLVLSLGILTSVLLLIALLFNYFSSQRSFLRQGRIDSRLKLLELNVSKYSEMVLRNPNRKEPNSTNDGLHGSGVKTGKIASEDFLKAPASAPIKVATDSNKLVSKVAPVAPAKAPVAQVVPPKAAVAEGAPAGPTPIENLLEKFRAAPRVGDLQSILTRLWNERGEITRPAALIHKYPQLVGQFNARGALLVRQINDAANMQAALPPIPPRSSGPLVEPAEDRVLYCVHATPEFHSNGYAIRTQGVAEGLVSNGRKVRVVGRPGYPWDVIIPNKPNRERLVNDNGILEYVYLPVAGLDQLPRGTYMQVAADALVREALKFRPAVIQSASNSQTALPALIAARRLGIPFVYEVRGLWEVTQATKSDHWGASERYELDAALETQVAVEADAVSVITRQLGEELVRRGVSKDKISIIPNAVDIDLIRPLLKDPVYKPAPGLGNAPLIGFAGSLVSYEGLDLLIEAVGLLNAQGTECRLVIAGSGNHELELQKAVKKLGHELLVHFVGRIPHDDVRRLLASLDVVVCPRNSNRVTEMVSPLKPLEAFAAGRVVLMSDVAPQRDLAADGAIAPLFKADNVESLKNELRRLIEDADLRRDFERRARLWVGDERTWQRVCAKLIEAHSFARDSLRSSLQVAPAMKSLPSIRLAAVGAGALAVPFGEHCEVVSVDPSSGSWAALLEDAHFDAVVSSGRTEESGWTISAQKEFFRLASTQNVPTILVSEKGSNQSSVINDLARYTDHTIFVGGSEIEPESALKIMSEASVSILTPVFDPRKVSPLGRKVRSNVVAVLPEDVPSERVLDIARVHGLLICAMEDSNHGLPKRFAKHSEFFGNSDQVVLRARETLAILRGVSPKGPNVTMEANARGLIEIVAEPNAELDTLDDRLGQLVGVPDIWLRSAWSNVREAHRTGTVTMILTMLLRAAGVSVGYRRLGSYAVRIESGSKSETQNAVWELLSQSVAPAAIVVSLAAELSEESISLARRRGVQIVDKQPENIDFIGSFVAGRARTFYEDLLTTATFEKCDEVRVSAASANGGEMVSRFRDGQTLPMGLQRTDGARSETEKTVLVVHEAESASTIYESNDDSTSASSNKSVERKYVEADGSTTRVLIPGHDLKFITGISEALVAAGAEVEIDKWKNHTVHDEAKSVAALNRAHVVLCEWGLGNAIWYSKHKLPNQRLYVRVHSQEIKTSYLKSVNHDAVDGYIFVNDLVREIAVAFHGVPMEKTVIIPNGVDVERLQKSKTTQANKTIGFVGAVPKAKRLDVALDVLEKVRETDPEYRMVVKGKGPEDFPWMMRRPDEMAWYTKQYDRIAMINELSPDTVLLEGHGDDMADWYSGVGVALSTSDFESFHFTIADGAASGARPAVLYWPGADGLYPRRWISNSVEQVAEAIINGSSDPADTAFVVDRYSLQSVSKQIQDLIAPIGEQG